MQRLSEQARRGIARKVRVICLCRKTILPALIVGLVALEAALVSLGAVFSGALSSVSRPEAFWNFWVAAVTNAEAHVLVIAGLLLVLGAVFAWRIFASGLTGLASLVRIRRNA